MKSIMRVLVLQTYKEYLALFVSIINTLSLLTIKLKYYPMVIIANMTSKQHILTFKRSADAVYAMGDFTSATILYFKTLFALHDYLLLEKIGYAPKDHTERFRLLQQEFPELYAELDAEFNTYRSTYTRIASKETCNRIKKMIEHAITTHHIA